MWEWNVNKTHTTLSFVLPSPYTPQSLYFYLIRVFFFFYLVSVTSPKSFQQRALPHLSIAISLQQFYCTSSECSNLSKELLPHWRVFAWSKSFFHIKDFPTHQCFDLWKWFLPHQIVFIQSTLFYLIKAVLPNKVFQPNQSVSTHSKIPTSSNSFYLVSVSASGKLFYFIKAFLTPSKCFCLI